MKNKVVGLLVLALVLALVCGPVTATNRKGIRFGYIDSKLDKGSAGLFDRGYTSFYVGFFNDQRIIPMLYFSSGLDYYQTGSKASEGNKLVLHYISVPLGLKLKVGPVHGMAGLHGALKVSSKLTVVGEDVSSKDFKSLDAGAYLGAGIQIFFIAAEFKYNWGLVDIYNGYKNNFWQAGLTLSF